MELRLKEAAQLGFTRALVPGTPKEKRLETERISHVDGLRRFMLES